MLWSRSTDRRYAPPTIQQLTGGHRGRAEIRSTEYDTPRARATHRSTHGKMCWGFSQRLIAAYAHPDRRRGKTSPTEAINGRLDALRRNALGLPELRALMRGDSGYRHTLGFTPSILLRIHHIASMVAAPTTPTASAIDVVARFEASSRNFSRASGRLKITT